MKLLANGFTTGATTIAGTTAGAREGFPGGAAVGPAKSFNITKIVAFAGGTTAAAGSSGLLKFRYGQSSDAVFSTLILLASAHNDALTSAAQGGPQKIVLDGLNISCGWFDADVTIISAGVGIYIFGD